MTYFLENKFSKKYVSSQKVCLNEQKERIFLVRLCLKIEQVGINKADL